MPKRKGRRRIEAGVDVADWSNYYDVPRVEDFSIDNQGRLVEVWIRGDKYIPYWKK